MEINLPEDFREKLIRTWGEEAHAWLARFPDILEACVQKWGLEVLAAYPKLSYNYVAAVRTIEGREAVLKIGVPNPELTTEMEALRAFNGRRSAALLEADEGLGALLVERLIPAGRLHELGDNAEEARVAAGMMRELPIPEPDEHAFPSVQKWAEVFDRVRENYDPGETGLPPELLEEAGELAEQLTATQKGNWLLHGDLHHENILFDRTRGWTAIDPKGVIGDRAYEAARFLHNPIPAFLDHPDPATLTRERLDILSSHLDMKKARLLAWAFVDCALAACWDVEEGNDAAYFVACARIMRGLREEGG